MKNYPADARSPSGELWWELRFWPGTKKQKFGVEPRLAAWLMFNCKLGDVFTMRSLRAAIGEPEKPNDDEHFNRRFRNLRKYGWNVLSGRDASELSPDEYRFERFGDPIYLGKSQFAKKAASAKVRRYVLDRDGHRCVVCGIGAGEAYPGEPTSKARLTLGHFVADSLSGQSGTENLRTECARCNEPAKEEAPRSEAAAEIWPRMRSLGRAEKARLLSWIEKGQRVRDAVDGLYDLYRSLPAPQRDELRIQLERAVK